MSRQQIFRLQRIVMLLSLIYLVIEIGFGATLWIILGVITVAINALSLLSTVDGLYRELQDAYEDIRWLSSDREEN